MLHQMIEKALKKRGPVFAAVIGAGDFGKVVVTGQSQVPGLEIPIVADVNVDLAREALVAAGFDSDIICYSNSAEEATALIKSGKKVYTDHAEIIMEIPFIEVICEGTGVPEAGAVHCKLAIENGKHVAVINKEVDSVIGPMLKRMADEKGVVYTPVQGDQHGLLLSLAGWAKTNGFTILSAGKARDVEFILDEEAKKVSVDWEGITDQEWETKFLSDEELKYFAPIPAGKEKEYVTKRDEIIRKLPRTGDFDFCELTIMANHLNLCPADPKTSNGVLRISEVPRAYSLKTHGGIYDKEGTVDSFACLRKPEDAGMNGGVYIIVQNGNAFSQKYLSNSGVVVSDDKACAMLYRPFHLCGMELSETILAAAVLGAGCAFDDYAPRYDMVKTAAKDIKAGEIFGGDHDERLSGMIVPATKRAPESAIPGHLLDGNRALVDIPKGTVITYAHVEAPVDSTLWQLRQKQEELFG